MTAPNVLAACRWTAPGQTPDRINDLVTNNGFAASEIGLFQNPNSAMQAQEEQLWTGARPVVKCSVDANGNVNPATYRD